VEGVGLFAPHVVLVGAIEDTIDPRALIVLEPRTFFLVQRLLGSSQFS
jgi:hypothetical protein